jgi:hypothetical protein
MGSVAVSYWSYEYFEFGLLLPLPSPFQHILVNSLGQHKSLGLFYMIITYPPTGVVPTCWQGARTSKQCFLLYLFEITLNEIKQFLIKSWFSFIRLLRTDGRLQKILIPA